MSIITDVKSNGFVLLNNIERDQLIDIAHGLGEIMPQYDNDLFFEISYDEDKSNLYYSKTNGSIEPHIDGHDFISPPKYVLIYCVKNSDGEDGYTEVSKSQHILDNMPEHLYELAKKKIFTFETAPGKLRTTTDMLKEKVSMIDNEQNLFRYSFNYLKENLPDDKNAKELLEFIKDTHYKSSVKMKIPEKTILLLDNYNVLHSRTAYEDKSRKLLRIWIR